MKPFVYDFKRAFLRKSTLITLVLFIVAGIGLTYIVAQSIASSNSGLMYSGIAMAELDVSNKELKVVMGVYDNKLQPVSADISLGLHIRSLVGEKQLLEKSFELGSYKIEGTLDTNISLSEEMAQYISNAQDVFLEMNITRMNVGGLKVFSWYFIPLYSIGPGKSSTYSGCNYLGANGLYMVLSGERSIPFAGCSGLIVSQNKLYIIAGALKSLYLPTKIYYSVQAYNETSSDIMVEKHFYVPPNVNISSLKFLGNISQAMKVYLFGAELPTSLLSDNTALNVTLVALDANGNVIAAGKLVTSLLKNVVTNLISNTGIGLFSSFFPIVMLYLGYVLIAKPKSQGALEFILARPITRTDLFVTRYIAGILVAITAPALFVVALHAGLNALLGVSLNSIDDVLFYFGLSASLVAFYTLCYYIAVEFKGGSYLAVSIALYLLFLIGFQILGVMLAVTMMNASNVEGFLKIQSIINYFNPMGLSNLVMILIQMKSNAISASLADIVKLEYIVLDLGVWVAVPFVAGLYRFRNKNLAG